MAGDLQSPTRTDSLPCEELPEVVERLEFQGIAGRIVKEHRRLLAHLPPEADMGLDHERDPGLRHPVSQRPPIRHRQHDAKMRHRHVMAVDGIAERRMPAPRLQMRHDLMAEQVKIDPVLGASPFRTAEHATIESPRRGKVIDRESDVEGSETCHERTGLRGNWAYASVDLGKRRADGQQDRMPGQDGGSEGSFMATTIESKESKRLGVAICTRKLTMELDGKTSEVVVQLGRPKMMRRGRSKRAHWVCPFEISGIGMQEPVDAHGADGFQALMQALVGIRSYLDRSGGLFSGWINDGYAGFPKFIHEGWGLGFVQKCEQLLDTEHAKLMDEIERKKLANPAYIDYMRERAESRTTF